MRRGYNKFLTITLVAIIVGIIGLMAYLGITYYRNYKIQKDAASAVDAINSKVSVDTPDEANSNPITNPTNNTDSNISTNSNENIYTTDDGSNGSGNSNKSSTKKRQLYKNGFYMIGTIEIPKTGIKYPILEKVTRKSLETSVAVIWPEEAEVNKPGNIVIVGHNYRNGLFFSNNKKLSKGDNIYISDLNGNKVAYSIYKKFETTETDTGFYNRDTKGKREITLSTCTDDSKKRVIIQAVEK